MELLAGIFTAAAIFVASALAFGPPPQPPFPYPFPGDSIGVVPTPVRNDCGKRGSTIALWPGKRPDLLPTAGIGWGPLQRATVRRPRIFLAKRAVDAQRWVYLLDESEGAELAKVDFRRCAVLAVFVPGDVNLDFLGVRKNDDQTITVGLATPPHLSGHVCSIGTTGSASGPLPPTEVCSDIPPVPGAKFVAALPAAAVVGVQRVYGITQPPPPPPPPNSTTG
jgi:hypothetical protein